MQITNDESLTDMIDKVVNAKDAGDIIRIFKKLLLSSYGEISADGRRFVKSPQLAEEFSQTVVYNILFTKYGSDAEAAAKFVNGVVPKPKEEVATPVAASIKA